MSKCISQMQICITKNINKKTKKISSQKLHLRIFVQLWKNAWTQMSNWIFALEMSDLHSLKCTRDRRRKTILGSHFLHLTFQNLHWIYAILHFNKTLPSSPSKSKNAFDGVKIILFDSIRHFSNWFCFFGFHDPISEMQFSILRCIFAIWHTNLRTCK